MSLQNRRDVQARKINLFQKLAATLVKCKCTPNQISIMSSVFALITLFAFYLCSIESGSIAFLYLFVGILGIQLRLICNLIDGLMAVEGGLKTASGELFNDVPDRVSDLVILIGAGLIANLYSPHMLTLSWLAAVMAIMTAYVRCLGAAMTGTHDFAGPMAKQHRMFTITVGAVGSLAELYDVWPRGLSMSLALMIVLLGSTLTVIHRLHRTYSKLENKT